MRSSAVLSVAALVERVRYRIIDHFMAFHAIEPEEAVDYLPTSPLYRREFDALLARGLVRQAGYRRYWVDLAACQADVERRRRRAVPIVVATAIASAVALTFLYRG
ncbi:hypothetical protein TPR58_16775 [Sphingomonas sp. HF-S3]|uniref:Uncharacterized protein n=1 Tax=Sphingomonas rustica TaxID=3103142 RepID=A0ABV0BD80_9SPHN